MAAPSVLHDSLRTMLACRQPAFFWQQKQVYHIERLQRQEISMFPTVSRRRRQAFGIVFSVP
jgi:hypothetical protein